jgi:hypothetical protein
MASRHDTIFAFVVMPKLDEWTVDEYRRNRGNSLRNYCIAIKGQHPEVRHVVGISTNPLGEEWRSEEVVYLDATEWTEEQQRGAEDLRKQTGLYMSPTITQLGDLSHKLMSDDQRRRERNRRKRERRTRNRAG